MTSQPSFNPSESVSLRLGLVPYSASSEFGRPSRSGSPFGPLSGSGKVSLFSPVVTSSSLGGEDDSISAKSASPSSRGSRPLATSQPSSNPSPSVSLLSKSVPYCVVSIRSLNPSSSKSAPSSCVSPSGAVISSPARSKPTVVSNAEPTIVYIPAKQMVAVIATTAH